MKKLLQILCLILGLGLSAKAQTSVALMPIPHPQFFGQNGQPLAGCKIFTYVTGTSTPLGTFFDPQGTIPNQNPVTCDAGGFVSIWLIVGDTYRILVQDQFGTQQYIIDGVVGVGGGSLSLFSTPNTWTALQTFSGGANINGGNLTGVFTGNPAFSGIPQFTSFSISNSTVIPNLNASFWNGTSVTPAGGSLTSGFVPVISGGAAATWSGLSAIAGTATLGQLPGSGVTTVGATTCTIGANCGNFITTVVYNTASASTNANITTTNMVTVGGNNASYRFDWYVDNTVVGASCSTQSTVAMNVTFTDPNFSPTATNLSYAPVVIATTNGTLSPGGAWAGTWGAQQSPFQFRAKSGSVISYTTTFVAGTGCSPAPQYQVFPVLEQVSLN